MKKQALILICALTAGSFLTGCNSSSSSAVQTEVIQAETETKTVQTQEQTETETAQTQDQTETETVQTQSETETASDLSAQKEELTSLLDRVKNLETGTAGSTLKLTGLTADFCDFCAETPLDDTEIAGIVEDYLDTSFTGGEDLEVFKENWQSVENLYRRLIDREEDESEQLEEAGKADSLYPYGYQEIDAMETVSSTIDNDQGR